MARIEPHGPPQMLPRVFELAHFFQHAAQIEMRQPVLCIACKRAVVAVCGLLEISLFVVQRSAIDQRVRALWILPQRMLVSVNGFRPRLAVRAVRLVVERQCEPLIRAELGERRLHLRKLFAKRRQCSAQAACGNSLLDELLDGAKRDEVAEIVKAVALIVPSGNQFEAVPIVQLFWRQTQDTLDFVAAESVCGPHEDLKMPQKAVPVIPRSEATRSLLLGFPKKRIPRWARDDNQSNSYPTAFFPFFGTATGPAAAAGSTARTGGFFAGAWRSARLFFNASIKSITGAMCGCWTSVTSWPLSFAAIIARTFS